MGLEGAMSFDSSMSDRTNELIAQINRNLANTKIAFEGKILGVENDRILKLIESLGKKINSQINIF